MKWIKVYFFRIYRKKWQYKRDYYKHNHTEKSSKLNIYMFNVEFKKLSPDTRVQNVEK